MAEEDDAAARLANVARAVSDANDADVIVVSGLIGDRLDIELAEQVGEYSSRPNAFVILTTNGGSPDSAYRIARCLQQRYRDGKIILFVDTACKSAGTLIALGANEIVMSDLAELGPLDVQVSKSDEFAEMTSGLIPVQAMSVLRSASFESFMDYFLKLRFGSGLQITTKTALDVAAKLTIGLFEKLYEQLDPMRLGEYQRAMMIAHEYGSRIATENIKENSLNRLIADYPSHGFVIDRMEAESLFCEIRGPSDAETQLAAIVKPAAIETLRRDGAHQVQFLPPPEPDHAPETDQDQDPGRPEPGEVPAASARHRQPPTGNGGPQPAGAGAPDAVPDGQGKGSSE